MKKRLSNLLAAGFLLCFAAMLPTMASASDREDKGDAMDLVKEAAGVMQQFRADARGTDLVRRAKGIFIVPDYARASLGVGASGGQGVLMANKDGKWTGPAFYNIGGLNLGLAAGVEAGSIAFVLLSDHAIEEFSQQNNFSLNADAGLTIIDWSKRAQATAGKGADVIIWSDTEGLYGNLSVSVSDISWDDEANRAYYAENVNPGDIVKGSVQAPDNNPLRSEFSAFETDNPETGKMHD